VINLADDKLFDLVSKIYSEMQEGFNTVNNRLDNLEKEVKNNSIKLESIETKLNTMAEVQL
jgi:hypothetical protein